LTEPEPEFFTQTQENASITRYDLRDYHIQASKHDQELYLASYEDHDYKVVLFAHDQAERD
jgi:hypothetical protein